ncbi:MAG: peroxiredoxin [Deltaproteobacteria bacterium]|nr:peroxiredoxin [Deltaproteobacteria bacterium]
MNGPSVGQKCPHFSALDMEGQRVSDVDLRRDGALVLYFYPKDETPGCTAEACAFRDDHEEFVAAGATVVGVSPDSPESHRAFVRNHEIPFRLLSDPNKELFKLFGVTDTLGILPGRETFVIDANGVVQHRFRSQLFARKHVANALASLKKRKGEP